MVSQTVEYALRAMAQLAADPSGAATTKDIAAKAKVPSAYLAKVLQSMRRGGLIHSRRGVGGTLAKPAAKIALLDVIDVVEALKRTPSKKAPGAAQLQKSMESAVDQLRTTFASESLADMLPKGETVKAAARGTAAKRPAAKNR